MDSLQNFDWERKTENVGFVVIKESCGSQIQQTFTFTTVLSVNGFRVGRAQDLNFWGRLSPGPEKTTEARPGARAGPGLGRAQEKSDVFPKNFKFSLFY